MIHLEAVYHRASQQFCYALNEEILMVGLQTGEEVEQVWIHYGDPFSTGILGGNEAWEGQSGGDRDKNASAPAPLVGNSRAASL